MSEQRVAVVTGASAGIGAATALRLAKEGFHPILGARRADRLRDVAEACGGEARMLDVTDPRSVQAFASGLERVHVLVNNAGMAAGMTRVEDLDDAGATLMWETNVLGLLRVTRALLPALRAAGESHIVNIGSVAGFEVYSGGGGYTATKHAARAISLTLRRELLGEPIRITEVNPGLVETEFSLVRFEGDREKAKRPYLGLTPLVADDVADGVAWAVTRPSHVNIDEIVLRPRDQATTTLFHRREHGS